MKRISESAGDSLQPEYKRSDFGEMVQGKYAMTQVEFAELVRLLLVCIGEDEGLEFIHHSGNDYKAGDWTYEMDNANQIILRHWLNESRNIEELVSSPCCITTHKERLELQTLLREHVQKLKCRVIDQAE
jgi:hypothetical protein